MTPPIGKLRKRSEFLRVAAAQNKWVTPGLILQAMRRQPESSSSQEELCGSGAIRIGYTVTKKVGKAVERNRVRRRLRAAAAEVVPQLGKPGHDYVLIGRRVTLFRSYEDLKADLQFALKRVKTDRRKAERHPAAKRKPDASGTGASKSSVSNSGAS